MLIASSSVLLQNVVEVLGMQRSRAEQGRRAARMQRPHPDQWSPRTQQEPHLDYNQASQAYTAQAFTGYPTTAEGMPYYPPEGHDPRTQEAVPMGYPVAPDSHAPMEDPHQHNDIAATGSPSSSEERRRRRRQNHQAPSAQQIHPHHAYEGHGGHTRHHRLVHNDPHPRDPLHDYYESVIWGSAIESATNEEAAEDVANNPPATTTSAAPTTNDVTAGGDIGDGDGADGCCFCGADALEGCQHCGDCIGNAVTSVGSTIGDGLSAAGDALCYVPKAICDNCFWPTCPDCSGCTCPDCDCCTGCSCDGCCDGLDLSSF